MKPKLIKTAAFLFAMILIFNLFGCNTSSNSNSKEEVLKAKTTQVNKVQENSTSKTAQATVKQPESKNKEKSSVTSTTKTNDRSNNNSATVNTNASSGNSPTAIANTKINQAKKVVSSQKPAATPSQPAAASKPAPKPPVQTVKLTITGPNEQSAINRSLTVKIKAGDTVLDVLLNGIGKDNVDYTGNGASAYVRGIENVYELDYGPNSGWTVSLNGTKLTRSAGNISVKANDKIAWIYTKDYTVNK